MKRYQKLRGKCQEVDYNLGRMFHQLGILVTAIYFYERVLHKSEVPQIYNSESNNYDENGDNQNFSKFSSAHQYNFLFYIYI